MKLINRWFYKRKRQRIFNELLSFEKTFYDGRSKAFVCFCYTECHSVYSEMELKVFPSILGVGINIRAKEYQRLNKSKFNELVKQLLKLQE